MKNKVIGIDSSRELIRICRERYEDDNTEMKEMDIRRIEYKEFDRSRYSIWEKVREWLVVPLTHFEAFAVEVHTCVTARTANLIHKLHPADLLSSECFLITLEILIEW